MEIAPKLDASTYQNLGIYRQEIRFTHAGGGPSEMEVIFETTDRGVEIKIWNPFKHEWSTVNPDAIMNHGDTRP